MEKRLMTFIACLFLSLGMALAQTQVSGTITSSEDGSPVIGASIKVAGTNTGTVTDVDGNFSLNAPANAKLEISYIGMIGKTVKAGKNMKIVLDPDNHALDEVMVVAFGTAKKSAFTGSAAVVGSEELSKKISTNVTDALVGSVPGLQLRGTSGQPGSDNNGVNIRGIASMYAATAPLVIVDGAPYPGNLSSIPTEDIESVTVLKDAASAALYGARGAAGVILITTKSGKNKDAEVTVDMKWGSNSRAIPEYDVIRDPGQYYEAYYMQYNNYALSRGMDATSANAWANKTMLNQLVYNCYTLPDGESLIGTDGKLNPNATLGRTITANGQTLYLTPDNWADAAYKNSFRQEYNISVRGALDRGSFYASLGYLDDNGVIENSSYKRYSGRIKADYQAKKWLKLAANAQFVHSDTEQNPNLSSTTGSSGNMFYFVSRIAPIYPLYIRGVDESGNPYILTDQYGHKRYDYGTPANGYGMTRPYMATGNPIAANQYNKWKQGMNQINANIAADISFTDWLKLNLSSTVTYDVFDLHDYLNSFEGPNAGANGSLKKSNTANLRTNNVQTLTFLKQFGKHNVDALLGHEYYRQNVKYLEGNARYEFSPYIQELYAYANPYSNTSYQTDYNVEGYFGRAQYNYDEKYFASASYRRDGSSYFAKSHRWGNFWSLGAAWIISKESWFNAPWVDNLKLKVSYGQQGNDNIGSFAYTNLYTLTVAGTTTISPSFYRVGNEDITWETTNNFNVGVEFSLFKNRLSGNIDFYSKKTSDLLFWLSIPESNGSRGYYGNVGDIRNNGIEFALTGSIIRTRDLDWSVSLNMSHNSTKVLKLPESKTKDYGGFSEANPTRTFQYWYREGGPLYNAFLPKYAGVSEDGQALYWVDDELQEANAGTRPGKNMSSTTTDYSKATYYEMGSLLPKVFGGFSTNFSFKGFDASLIFDFQLGGKVYDSGYAVLMDNAYSAGRGLGLHKDIFKSWSADNTSSNIPRYQYGDQYVASRSDRFLESASYLNFQSFSVGYTFPKGMIPLLSKLRVYVMGENLCFWSARKGLDPRFSYDGSSSYGSYSPTRNISGGIQVTF